MCWFLWLKLNRRLAASSAEGFACDSYEGISKDWIGVCTAWWLVCKCQWALAHKGSVHGSFWPFHSYEMDSTVLDIQVQGRQGNSCTDHFQNKGKQQWNLRLHA